MTEQFTSLVRKMFAGLSCLGGFGGLCWGEPLDGKAELEVRFNVGWMACSLRRTLDLGDIEAADLDISAAAFVEEFALDFMERMDAAATAHAATMEVLADRAEATGSPA